ncbi:hypothetical protein [Hymenobacter radiodurans]|uniref:hypothetical protein n=1 Tax=Hymenobacter radiodurans TaxID=2496028 RepID=UPI001058A57D|nr:hypothetical protein [Hymenobacter radiodurans]
MKKLLLLSLLFLSIHFAQAQTATTPRAPADRNHEIILIELTDSPEATWRRLAQVLMQRGYGIEHSDKDLLTLATYPLEGFGFPIRVVGLLTDKAIMLRMYQSRGSEPGKFLTERIRRRGGDNVEWLELEAIARDMGGRISYAVSTNRVQ